MISQVFMINYRALIIIFQMETSNKVLASLSFYFHICMSTPCITGGVSYVGASCKI